MSPPPEEAEAVSVFGPDKAALHTEITEGTGGTEEGTSFYRWLGALHRLPPGSSTFHCILRLRP